MSYPSGQIIRGKLSLQHGGRLVRLLRSCDLSPASCPRPFASGRAHPSTHSARQPNLRHTHLLPPARRPHKWGCRLTTSCQVAASSPRTAAVESAEAKSSKQQGQLVTLPTTDESPQLDRIRHSVSTDLKSCCNSTDLYIHPFRCCHVRLQSGVIPHCSTLLMAGQHCCCMSASSTSSALHAAVLTCHGHGSTEAVPWSASHHWACHRARLLL